MKTKNQIEGPAPGVTEMDELNDLIHRQMKARYDINPASLTLTEKGALMLAAMGRVARKEQELKALKDKARGQLEAYLVKFTAQVEECERNHAVGNVYLLDEPLDLAEKIGYLDMYVKLMQLNSRLDAVFQTYEADAAHEKINQMLPRDKWDQEATKLALEPGWTPDTKEFRDEVRRRVYLLSLERIKAAGL
jgi:hypothetical protein